MLIDDLLRAFHPQHARELGFRRPEGLSIPREGVPCLFSCVAVQINIFRNSNLVILVVDGWPRRHPNCSADQTPILRFSTPYPIRWSIRPLESYGNPPYSHIPTQEPFPSSVTAKRQADGVDVTRAPEARALRPDVQGASGAGPSADAPEFARMPESQLRTIWVVFPKATEVMTPSMPVLICRSGAVEMQQITPLDLSPAPSPHTDHFSPRSLGRKRLI